MKERLFILFLLVSGSQLEAQKYYAEDGNYDQEYNWDDDRKMRSKGNTYIAINYNIASPLGSDFKSYIEASSFSGIGLELNYFLNENITIGGQTSYQSFNDRYEDVLEVSDDGFEKSTQFRSVRVFDLMAISRYHFQMGDYLYPYVGFGVGVARVSASTEISRYLYSDSSTSLKIKPEVGFMLKLSNNVFINANYSYNSLIGAFSNSNLNYSGYSAGIVIK